MNRLSIISKWRNIGNAHSCPYCGFAFLGIVGDGIETYGLNFNKRDKGRRSTVYGWTEAIMHYCPCCGENLVITAPNDETENTIEDIDDEDIITDE